MEFWLLVVIGILLIIIFSLVIKLFFRTQNCTRNRSAIY